MRIGPDEVDVADIGAVKRIHRVKTDFHKTDAYKGVGINKENVVSTQNIELHRRHRKLLAQPISENGLKAMHPQIEQKVRLAIEKMTQEMKTRGAVDVYKWWLFMATDVIGQLTFDESFHALERGKVGKENGCKNKNMR